MSSSRAIYAGSFDLFTNGHYEIVKRAQKVFDELTILVAVSPYKKTLFNHQQRVEMLARLFAKDKKIKLDFWNGLIVEYAKKNQIFTIIRGLRPTGDFEGEFQMASMNRRLHPEIDTIFFMTGPDHYFLSSTLIKEIYGHGGNIKEFIPSEIYQYLLENNSEGTL